MGLSLEPLPTGSFLGRGGDEHESWKSEDPYEFCVVFVPQDDGSYLAKGFAARSLRGAKDLLKQAEKLLGAPVRWKRGRR